MSALPSTIRASSIAAMLGLDPRRSPLALFHELRGIQFEPEDDGDDEIVDDPVLEGRMFEDAVANVVRRKFKLVVGEPDGAAREITDRCIIGHPDRVFMEPGEGSRFKAGILEVKNPFFVGEGWGDPGSDVVPRQHWVQTQVYQGLFVKLPGGPSADVAPHGYVAARLRGVQLYKVQRDDEVYEKLQQEAERFLHRVHENDPPTPRDEHDMRRRWLVDESKTVKVDAGFVANAKQLRDLNEQIRIATKAASDLKTLLLGTMQDAREAVWDSPDGPIVVATCGANRVFDVERFKAEQPDLAARFTKLDRTALKKHDQKLYDAFMRRPVDVAEQTRVLRLANTLASLDLGAAT